ncbi:hypothetical protein [Paracoccus sp. (in: a-proteobacteria)]|uniref:hypothetical protein n=1 Tax=Paracoccus sp. TaxID=267 RepID=UPI002AFE9A8A|nr:hypothetical protein [Paracoccus sp. (in: a-proteobacteria)]
MVIAASDDVPEHLPQIAQVPDDHVIRIALTGLLAGGYGERDFPMILGALEHGEAWLGPQQSF